ncbi:nucleoside 2-deoxyribosyltransferase [Clostridium phage phi8074-B1]|uniref:nucleoside 2-deoxyribosyltransferase n=1 Tax=Clostridium phage phi8074-B1 TaxID=1147137 RepID=UPI00025C0C6D|nr:nucleoside 2-deoxyribosyltransferase [Clostridium phage phi8074-B1]AFC61990.1 putative nucleoside 2-deoxyribosyltransferase [Clostridium phage phi8074-B1]
MFIKIRNDLRVGNYYHGLVWQEHMEEELAGKWLEVEDIDGGDFVALIGNGYFSYFISPDMVEDISSERPEEPKKQVYIGGDMLTGGSILLRDKEKKDVQALGYGIYNPVDNKDINDKQAQGNAEDLPDRIVKQDTKALIESDIIVIEPQPYACGTMVELGQLKGMKDMAEHILRTIRDGGDIADIAEYCADIYHKPVYPHYEDIRRHDEPEAGDNRSLGINAYVYGVCKDLTRGKGFYEWNEILNILGGNN